MRFINPSSRNSSIWNFVTIITRIIMIIIFRSLAFYVSLSFRVVISPGWIDSIYDIRIITNSQPTIWDFIYIIIFRFNFETCFSSMYRTRTQTHANVCVCVCIVILVWWHVNERKKKRTERRRKLEQEICIVLARRDDGSNENDNLMSNREGAKTWNECSGTPNVEGECEEVNKNIIWTTCRSNFIMFQIYSGFALPSSLTLSLCVSGRCRFSPLIALHFVWLSWP